MAMMVWVGRMLSLRAVVAAVHPQPLLPFSSRLKLRMERKVPVTAVCLGEREPIHRLTQSLVPLLSSLTNGRIASTSRLLHHHHATTAKSNASTTKSNNSLGNEEDDGFDDHPCEECGLVEVMGDPDAMSLCNLGLQKLQHRGKEGVGIVAIWGDGKLKSVTWLGLVADVG
uniref:Amidophosphoribosyltransferase-like n=1 Tax=Oryza sativa subsp. japonica TaxID=39947 RepID=Q69UE0_ORYSJ|nr:amidophosphoribosyltransferase-like [Oryza sativa Japonica Group]